MLSNPVKEMKMIKHYLNKNIKHKTNHLIMYCNNVNFIKQIFNSNKRETSVNKRMYLQQAT